jgi:hypothetical protein
MCACVLGTIFLWHIYVQCLTKLHSPHTEYRIALVKVTISHKNVAVGYRQ